MAIRNRITEKFPRTGALPSEQAALKELHPDNGGQDHVWQQDKLIWQLVQNCVDYAAGQFSENLSFNSEVLTNVLYDNIYDLLGDKFEENEFVEWIVDKLIENGCVVKVQSSDDEGKKQKEEPKEEIVYELDDSEYKDLQARVGAAIQLVKASKVKIFKIFSDVDGQIAEFTKLRDDGQQEQERIIRERDQQISNLLKRLKGNQEKIDEYIQGSEELAEEIQDKIDEVRQESQKRFDEFKLAKDREHGLVEKIKDKLKKLQQKVQSFQRQTKKTSHQKSVVEQPRVKSVAEPPQKKGVENKVVDVVNQQTSNAPVEELQANNVLGERKGENVQQKKKKVEPKPSVHKENIQPKVLKESGPEKVELRKSNKEEIGDVQELTQQKKPVQSGRVVAQGKMQPTKGKPSAKPSVLGLNAVKKAVQPKVGNVMNGENQQIVVSRRGLTEIKRNVLNIVRIIEHHVINPMAGKPREGSFKVAEVGKLENKLPALKFVLDVVKGKKSSSIGKVEERREEKNFGFGNVQKKMKDKVLKKSAKVGSSDGKKPPKVEPKPSPSKNAVPKSLTDVFKAASPRKIGNVVAQTVVVNVVLSKVKMLQGEQKKQLTHPMKFGKEKKKFVQQREFDGRKTKKDRETIEQRKALGNFSPFVKERTKQVSVRQRVSRQQPQSPTKTSSNRFSTPKPSRLNFSKKPRVGKVEVRNTRIGIPKFKLAIGKFPKMQQKFSTMRLGGELPQKLTSKKAAQVLKSYGGRDLVKASPKMQNNLAPKKVIKGHGVFGKIKEIVKETASRIEQTKPSPRSVTKVGSLLKNEKVVAAPALREMNKVPSIPIEKKPFLGKGEAVNGTRVFPRRMIPRKTTFKDIVQLDNTRQPSSTQQEVTPRGVEPREVQNIPRPMALQSKARGNIVKQPIKAGRQFALKRQIPALQQRVSQKTQTNARQILPRIPQVRRPMARVATPMARPIPPSPMAGNVNPTTAIRARLGQGVVARPLPIQPKPTVGTSGKPTSGAKLIPNFASGRALPIGKVTAKKPSGKDGKDAKLTLIQKLQRQISALKFRLGMALREKLANLKERLSKSPIGTGYRFARDVTKVVMKTISVIYRSVVATTKFIVKTVKLAAKTVKVATKMFIKASVGVGRGIAFIGRTLFKSGKKFVSTIKKKKLWGIVNFAGAVTVVKLGFSLFKWGVRKLWKWIVAAMFKLGSMFKRLFRLGIGKFPNNVGFYMGRLGKFVSDKACKFLVKPIASILVTAFGFSMQMVRRPVEFMKTAISQLLERFRNTMTDLKSAAKSLMKSTWGVFKKILFNPITLLLLVAAVFYFFGEKLVDWLNSLIDWVKGLSIDKILQWLKDAWQVAKKVWNTAKDILSWIWQFIDFFTKPTGPIMKFIMAVWGIKRMIKKWFIDLMKLGGLDTFDIMCRWLAGDTIGLAIAGIVGVIKMFMKWFRTTWLYKTIVRSIKMLAKAGKAFVNLKDAICDSVKNGWSTLLDAMNPLSKTKMGDVWDKFTEPYRKWWSDTKAIFSDPVDNSQDDYQAKRLQAPTDLKKAKKEKERKMSAAFRGLGMKGMWSEKNMEMMNELAKAQGMATNVSVQNKLKQMQNLYGQNVTQVERYDNFLKGIWEEGKYNDEHAAKTLKTLLESPELSQMLISAFYYYNPQTGSTMMLRPAQYIGVFLKKIRNLVGTDESRDNLNVLKEIVKAFEQLNNERLMMINNQADKMTEFVTQVERINPNSKESRSQLSALVNQLNNEDLFSNISASQSFRQIIRGDAMTANQVSLTTEKGADEPEKMGTSSLLKIENHDVPPPTGVQNATPNTSQDSTSEKQYTVDASGGEKLKIGKVSMPNFSLPFKPKEELDTDEKEKQSLHDKWMEHMQKKGELSGKYSQDELEDMGYGYMSFNEFKKKHEKEKSVAEQRRNKEKSERRIAERLAGLRVLEDINAWSKAGTDIEEIENIAEATYTLGKDVPVYNIPLDTEVKLYMFSPEWRQMRASSKKSDEELRAMLESGELDSKDDFLKRYGNKTQEEIDAQNEEDRRKREEEEKERAREQEILDYSAKVTEDGYIELNVDEEEDMWNKYQENNNLYNNMKGRISDEEMEKRNIRWYSWQEWKVYYRKMHGIPENGIKRIKFNGQKTVQRAIDFHERPAFTLDELKEIGIEKSEEGPVMIPIDKAMEFANSLLAGAKTIYSIRDGLEVMKLGLDSENEKIKKKVEEGATVNVGQIGAPTQQTSQVQSATQTPTSS